MWTIGSHSKHTLSRAIYFLIRLTPGPSQGKCFLRRHHGINIAYVTSPWAEELFLRNHIKHQTFQTHWYSNTEKLPWTTASKTQFCVSLSWSIALSRILIEINKVSCFTNPSSLRKLFSASPFGNCVHWIQQESLTMNPFINISENSVREQPKKKSLLLFVLVVTGGKMI